MDEGAVRREEVINALTHGVGVAGSLAGGAVLITLAASFGSGIQVVSAVVFSVTLLLLYSASTLFHAIPHEVTRSRLRVVDHCAIFLLIAGTYTPFALVSMQGTWGWIGLGIVWFIALAGILFKLCFIGRFHRLSTIFYIAMGWLGIAALGPSLKTLDLAAIVWLAIGGVCYTAGTLFYHSHRIPYSHAVWHIFVLSGSFCHFAAVLTQVVPSA